MKFYFEKNLKIKIELALPRDGVRRYIVRILKYYNEVDLPVVNKTMAFRQLYSAASTWSALSFSTCSWNMRMWSM